MSKKKNPMRDIKVEKLVINIGAGEAADKLMRAEKVLVLITGKKPVRTISKSTNKDLGIRVDMPIGCKVTLRGKEAEEFLKTAIWTKENRLARYSFDQDGNFSFGIAEYTDFPNMKYDPNIGVFGFDVSVVLGRPGNRVKRRVHAKAKVGRSHRLTPEETKAFISERFKIELVE